MLVGRQAERVRIDELLEGARRGRSGVLVIRGEPGIGKTSLLAYGAAAAGDFTVVRTRGVESEAELAFSGLLDVCRPVLPHLADVGAVPARALRVALGLEAGESPDRLAIGASTLALLAAAAESAPLLVLVDDAQWVDEPSTDALLFAARRVQADAIAMLFALRDEEGARLDATGLEELRLAGLSRADAAALFAGTDLAPSVADELYAITGGNPLGLVELPTSMTPAQLSGAEPLSEPLVVGSRLEHAFAAHLERLGDDDRAALALAAASSTTDLALLVDAAARTGLDPAAFERAEDAGLVRLSPRELQFRHPIVRSVLHQSATASQRRRTHRVLADAFANAGDEESAAWHAAAAALGPDVETAQRLESVAQGSRQRGAYVAAANAFERAAQLTADRDLQRPRLFAAAESFWTAGRTDHARSLLDEMLPHVSGELRGRGLLLRGQIEQASGDVATSCRLLLEAADLLREHNPKSALDAWLFAYESALAGGEPELGLQIAERVRSGENGGGSAAFLAKLIYGVASVVAGEEERGSALVREALSLADSELLPDERDVHRLAIAASWGLNDFEQARKLVAPLIERLRGEGNLAVLPTELGWMAWLELCCGRVRQAQAAAAESLALAQASGQKAVSMTAHMLLSWLAAIRGDHDACVRNAEECIALGPKLHRTFHQLLAERSLGLLALGEGKFEEAVRTLSQAQSVADAQGLGGQFHALRADLVEALVRSGRHEDAAAEAATLTPSTIPNDRAITERVNALLEHDGLAEARFVTALEWHRRGRDVFEEARTHLCFGERLRRKRRRTDARTHLREALATFDLLGARDWGERAEAELRATGEHYRRRDPSALERLTPQELEVALKVGEGKANREVAAALFLSPKTVEFHLTRVYRKLNVRSRAELARVLASEERRDEVMQTRPTNAAKAAREATRHA